MSDRKPSMKAGNESMSLQGEIGIWSSLTGARL